MPWCRWLPALPSYENLYRPVPTALSVCRYFQPLYQRARVGDADLHVAGLRPCPVEPQRRNPGGANGDHLGPDVVDDGA